MKFINLLKKELSELINKQMLISLAVTMFIFMLLGNFMGTVIDEASSESYTINLSDLDNSDTSKELIDSLKGCGITIYDCTAESDDYSAVLEQNDVNSMIIIPKGFEEDINSGITPELVSVSSMHSASAVANISDGNYSGISAVEACLRNMLASREGISDENLALLDAPVMVSEHTVVADKSANISADMILNKIMMQNMLLPIIVFVLILMTSQMLISAISNEKIDKTLETLLSAPVSRSAVIGAKMLAAAIVALLNAAAYMFGMSFFMNSAVSDTSIEGLNLPVSVPDVDDALSQLGLSLSVTDYLLVGLQLFMTILICLSISIILGALVNDTKSSQTMIMPLMFMAMIPYMISMLSDINTLPTVVKIAVYAIPFTHTFSAMSNLMFGNTAVFFGGLVYQVAVFAVCMFFALRLFKSDKLFTISLNFGQKSKFKKNSKTEE